MNVQALLGLWRGRRANISGLRIRSTPVSPDRIFWLTLLALAYFALAKIGLALASLHPSASPVWPPSGLALAGVLLWGSRVWPAIALGALVANITTFGSLWTSIAIASGNTLEALITAWLLQRWSGGAATLETPRGVVRFAGLALAPGTMVSATLGVGSLMLGGLVDGSKFIGIWMTWWLGDVGGQVLVAPFIMLWGRSLPLDRKEALELGKLLLGTATVGLIAFSPMVEQTTTRGALAFLAIAPMLWAALRYRQRDTATAALVLSCFAIWGTLANGGPFVRPSLNESFLLVLTFVISTAMPSLVLSADVAVRRKAERDLREAHAEVEARIEARTSELGEANRALQATQRLLDGVQDHAIFMLDTAGNVTSRNKGASRIEGYAAEDILGQSIAKFYTPEDRAAGLPAEALAAAARDGKYEAERWHARQDGSKFWAAVVIEAIRDSSGEVSGFVKITRDVTERRLASERLEATRNQLVQSQKMEALGKLTGGIAHDFNNALAVVLSNLELLRTRASLAPALTELIDRSERAIERASGLTQRMLSFARRQDLRPEPVDISQLVGGMVELLKRTLGPKIIIGMETPRALPPAMVDAGQLELAIMNLALNARDAMPTGGALTILVEEHVMETDASGLAAGRYLGVGVTDTGIGMDASTLARAGEPFFTTKGVGKGTGLGLAMVRGLAEQSGGRLELKSAPGRGTRAAIWLPVAKQPAARMAVSDAVGEATRSLTVLAVDDDRLVLMGTVGMLEDLGHAAIEATSGEAALAVLCSGEDVDVLVTDQAMPGMTGTELIRAAHAQRPGLPVILATGYAEPAGIDPGIPVLKKPYLRQALAKAIARVLHA